MFGNVALLVGRYITWKILKLNLSDNLIVIFSNNVCMYYSVGKTFVIETSLAQVSSEVFLA